MNSKWLSRFAVGGLAGLVGAGEILGIGALGGSGPQVERAVLFLAGHGLASIAAAAVTVHLLPRVHRSPPVWPFVFIFSVTFFIPVLGAVCLVLGFVIATRFPAQEKPLPWVRVPIPDFRHLPSPSTAQTPHREDGLTDILRHARNGEFRLQAVRAANQLPERKAVPILRMALGDMMDDVRLFAYSALDRKESAINAEIHRLRREMTQQGETPIRHARLAEQYWDLAYLGLAEGEVARYAIRRADHHARSGLESPEAPAMWFLLGRIALWNECLAEAERALARAEEAGINPTDLAPFRAEIAYRRRDFPGVREHLATLPTFQRPDSALIEVVEYWQ